MAERCESFDGLVIGSGIFGLQAARTLVKAGHRVLLIEQDEEPSGRASAINQARLHQGYHYPRSLTTGLEARKNFERFRDEFASAIYGDFKQIYAIAAENSMTTARGFAEFCEKIGAPLTPVCAGEYFRTGTVSVAFETKEYAFDARKICRALLEELTCSPRFHLRVSSKITGVRRLENQYRISLNGVDSVLATRVINTSYAGLNGVQVVFGQKPLSLKYELAEILIGRVPESYRDVGVTVLDGPFFSCMPWSAGEMHSLSAVALTPRLTSNEILPRFSCMAKRVDCHPTELRRCDTCAVRPATAAHDMIGLAEMFMRENFKFELERSRYTVKALLQTAEADDARPTVIQTMEDRPRMTTVLAGKIGTIYDLEAVNF